MIGLVIVNLAIIMNISLRELWTLAGRSVMHGNYMTSVIFELIKRKIT